MSDKGKALMGLSLMDSLTEVTIPSNRRSFEMRTLIVFLICLTGCTQYTERYTPTTPIEREKVQQIESEILQHIPSTIAGHDQDWDDAIESAHNVACRTVCRPTYWEFSGGRYTGKWQYADSMETKP